LRKFFLLLLGNRLDRKYFSTDTRLYKTIKNSGSKYASQR